MKMGFLFIGKWRKRGLGERGTQVKREDQLYLEGRRERALNPGGESAIYRPWREANRGTNIIEARETPRAK